MITQYFTPARWRIEADLEMGGLLMLHVNNSATGREARNA